MTLNNQHHLGPITAIVAGHICLDIIPDLAGQTEDLRNLMAPGRLLGIGTALLSTGGAVPNTGLALYRLGTPTRLMGKIGDDAFGTIICRILEDAGAGLSQNMIVAPGEHTSYSIVLNPPGTDRTFLHHCGTNDTYGPADVTAGRLAGAGLFHFGYPPLMKRLYQDNGAGLVSIFRHAKAQGAATSLDMVQFDLRSEAGSVDWLGWLRRVLPEVDLFLPSIDEIRLMLGDEGSFNGDTLSRVSEKLLGMGPAVVALKLGDQGLYLRTTADASRLARVGIRGLVDAVGWAARELLAPCFLVEVAGTTGAGDCTIAGLLAGVLRGLDIEQTMTAAVATGAHCVERPDAVSGVPAWDVLQRRVDAGWVRRPTNLPLPGWRWNEERSIACGPNDSHRRDRRAEK